MRYLIYMLSSLLIGTFFTGCLIESEKESNTRPVVTVIEYIDLSPTDMETLDTPHPLFSFERDTDGAVTNTLCLGTQRMQNVQLKVMKIDPLTSTATPLLNEVVQTPDDCRFEITFSSLTLEEGTPYVWRVSDPGEEESASTVWNSFVYMSTPVGAETEPTLSCENNLIDNWSMETTAAPWVQTDLNLTTAQAGIRLNEGDDDNASLRLTTPYEVVYEQLAQPIVQGERYQLKFSILHEGKSDFQIKALAFNGQLHSLEPDVNTSVIDMSGTMVYNNGIWLRVTMQPWVANKGFEKIAIVLINQDNQFINARIDHVCLTKAADTGCGATLLDPVGIPSELDINNTAGTATEFEYLAGSVSDLYPDADTDNVEWFIENNATPLECTTIGEMTLDDNISNVMNILDNNDSEAIIQQELVDGWLSEVNLTAVIDPRDLNLTTVAPLVVPDCKGRMLDPSLPFSGRDIVYVHGLQKKAVDELQNNTYTFTGRWPQDPAAFHIGGNQYYEEAAQYWEPHIRRALGDSANPSNSYLIVTWSALQRIPYGINAVLTQIKEGIEGTNPAVHLSQSAVANNQCFGDNGIVFITHSTGGTLVSTMFGEMEIHKNDPQYPNYVEPALQAKFDAQVGFQAAYGGSKVATLGLHTTHGTLNPSAAGVSVLVDLGVQSAIDYNRNVMNQSQKPSFLAVGSMTGPNISDSQTTLGLLYAGYNDGVLATWVQSADSVKNPRYYTNAINAQRILGQLYDYGVAPIKAASIIKKSVTILPVFNYLLFSPPTRFYNVTAALSPSGMLQNTTFAGYLDPPQHLQNHFPIIQTTSDHFGNVNKLNLYQPDYYRPFTSIKSNNEESSVVMYPSLYTQGYLSQEFSDLQQEWVRKKVVGFHFVKVTWVLKPIKLFGRVIGSMHVPKFTWHYYEVVIWKRTYHLLKDYKTKLGMDLCISMS